MMEEISFEEIKRLQQGEKQVFNKIIAIYQKRVTALCMKYMLNMDEAVDAAQEVFCSAYVSIKSFGFKSKFSTWLYRITVNQCINRLKSIKSRNAIIDNRHYIDDEEKREQLEFVTDGRKLSDEEMELKETGTAILRELDRFSEMDKSAIILSDMEDYSTGEIAEILDMPEGSVRSSISRTRRKLKEILEKKKGAER